jgi:hypothetical protein
MIGWLVVKSKASGLHMTNQLYTTMVHECISMRILFEVFRTERKQRRGVLLINSIKVCTQMKPRIVEHSAVCTRVVELISQNQPRTFHTQSAVLINYKPHFASP